MCYITHSGSAILQVADSDMVSKPKLSRFLHWIHKALPCRDSNLISLTADLDESGMN